MFGCSTANPTAAGGNTAHVDENVQEAAGHGAASVLERLQASRAQVEGDSVRGVESEAGSQIAEIEVKKKKRAERHGERQADEKAPISILTLARHAEIRPPLILR